MPNQEQLKKIASGKGFIAALDQSGGSTPKALKQYGIEESEYNGEAEMFAKVHEMRERIITAQAFNGDKIIGAILFEKTMDDSIKGIPTAKFLWENKNVVPFLKIDKGLEDEKDGVQLMKAMPTLGDLLKRAVAAGIFGTKERSVINSANESGIAAVVAQQFEVAKTVLDHGLVPIIEPEVNIKAADKAECEKILKAEILKHLDKVPAGKQVMLKLTLPEKADFYADLIAHKNVLLVVALSGGYSLDESCKRLAQNGKMVASFSRALTNDLRAQQSDAEFNTTLQGVIDKIYAASIAGEAKTKAA
ncbi:MAG TPA: fructose bisphosphate aldolase [Rhodospirillaceae bacterium]|nr:fructose bisphosphate aldolase [Rhodospirillaceae bacterium]